jgi:voltage-gated potassium channel
MQVLRIFKFVRIGLENDRFFNYSLDGRQVIAAEVITTVILILFIQAGLVLSFEDGVNPNFQNFRNAFYYSIVALTTGSGNVVPQTTLENSVTGVGLILTITVIPWLAFRVRQIGLVGGKERQRRNEVSHSQDANYCHECGEELEE